MKRIFTLLAASSLMIGLVFSSKASAMNMHRSCYVRVNGQSYPVLNGTYVKINGQSYPVLNGAYVKINGQIYPVLNCGN